MRERNRYMNLRTYLCHFPKLLLSVVLVLSMSERAAGAAEDPSAMYEAKLKFTAAEERLTAGDHDGAVELLEQGLAALPEDPGYAPTRAEVLLQIVDVHEAAFTDDGDLDRLRRAKELLDHYLGPLELLDEQGRADAEERRVRLIEKIVGVENRLRAEAAAREAAARRARAERLRRQGKTLRITGAASMAVGIAGLAAMGAGLGIGRAADNEITAIKEENGWSERCTDAACQEMRRELLDPLVKRGNAGNIMAIVGGSAGAVLCATGLATLIIARKRIRQAKQLEVTPSLSFLRGHIGISINGRF